MNRTWAAHLPPQVTTSHHFTFSLRVLCPGECGCKGEAKRIVQLVSELDENDLRLRYLTVPKDVERIEQQILTNMQCLVGAFLDDKLVGIIYISKGRDGEPIELAFVTDPQHTGKGIATVLLLAVLGQLKKVVGPCEVHAIVLNTNHSMREVCKKCGMDLVKDPEDPTTISFTRQIS